MIKDKGHVRFHILHSSFRLSNRKELRHFIQHQVESFGFKLDAIDYIFCTDNYLLDINRRHLGHDDYTDIITFDLSEHRKEITSEIYISIDRVKDNAGKFETGTLPRFSLPVFNMELYRVMFHGVLHLLGYKDKTPLARKKMRQAEDAWLAAFTKQLS